MSIDAVSMKNVSVADEFWSPRQRTIMEVTIPFMERILRDEVPGAEKSHAIDNFRMAAGEISGKFYGMVFQDSDVAKWLEAAAYSLALQSDAELSRRVDEVVDLIGRAQQEDGYLDTYFIVREPDHRWQNLLECHELYCAGHMIEAAVALKEAAGKAKLLEICTRLADHICDRFEMMEGVPGHQEIEIGLLRLYRATGNVRYREMASRFLNRRGEDPAWFVKNTPQHPGLHYGGYDIHPEATEYNQSDVPVRKQTVARGHAVRQIYMLTAMADMAAEIGDESLWVACERLFENITEKQMYITGAIGASAPRESFSVNYDLPSDRCYGETCASVAMVFFARQMLRWKADGRYADLMERELYNAALAGMQMDGKRFFYVNPLTVDLNVSGKVTGYEHVLPQRPAWHTCACCPPNLARLITSLGDYIWGETEHVLYHHLMIGGEVRSRHGRVLVESKWPWEGSACYTMVDGGEYTLAFHIPEYGTNLRVRVNGQEISPAVKDGYCYLSGMWQPGEKAEITCDFPVRRVYADPRVRDCFGKVALARGPFIYCFEAADQDKPVHSLRLPEKAEIRLRKGVPGLPEELIGLEMEGVSVEGTGKLYPRLPPEETRCGMTAIPYFAWANREKGDMTVWIPRA